MMTQMTEKMICRILLLIILNSCVCAATFEVNVTQSSYQAEENHNITLEWTFTTKPDSSYKHLFIYCSLIANRKEFMLYHVDEGVEVSKSQDERFKGRVQGDKDVLREGRIRLHVSRLRTNDSGLYLCEVNTDYGSSFGKCELNVTAAAAQPQTQRPPLSPEPETERWWTAFDQLIASIVAAVLLGLCFLLLFALGYQPTREILSRILSVYQRNDPSRPNRPRLD